MCCEVDKLNSWPFLGHVKTKRILEFFNQIVLMITSVIFYNDQRNWQETLYLKRTEQINVRNEKNIGLHGGCRFLEYDCVLCMHF